jgi:D-alanyl-D-alanine carboxypeptidase/D-alanyl-D-alanine-endopeptidase (penicillin-binding protein 4)
MKKFIPFFFLMIINLSFSQTNENDIKEKLDAVCSESFFDTTLISIDVYNLTRNEAVYQKNNHYLLFPASNMKILTSAAALLYLGEDYNFNTSLYYSGKIIDSTLNGSLYVSGGCDPNFSLSDLDTFSTAIKNLGINKINGNIYGDVSMMDSVYWGDGWMWNDDPSTDFPYLTPLNINRNSITVVVKPSLVNLSPEVTTYPRTEFVKIFNYAVTTDTSSTKIFVTRDYFNRNNNIIVRGTISANADSVVESVNVFNPAFYFLTLLKEKLILSGIRVTGRIDTLTVSSNAVLVSSVVNNLGNIIYNMNKTSYNLSAEMALLALGEKYFGRPSTAEKGIKKVNDLIKLCGMNPANYKIADGSGISFYNLISSELILEVLKYFYYNKPDLYKVLKNSFPVAGVDGTLKNRMRKTSAANNVHAKTGTISGVSCLSGYLKSKDGDDIAFSIMIQNYVKPISRSIEFQNMICKILADMK